MVPEGGGMSRYNCHIHTFTLDAVPDRLYPLRLVALARLRLGAYLLAFLGWIPYFRRLAALARIGRRPHQRDILELAINSYPVDTKFCPLSMDFEHAGLGSSPQSYLEQLEELAELTSRYPEIVRPFLAVDPRRTVFPDGIESLAEFVEHFIGNGGFTGIKLYPALGFFPWDERLDPVWEYAESNGIPIIAHCSRGGVHARGRVTEEMRNVGPPLNRRLGGWGMARFSDNYTDPENYEHVLARFRSLKVCLAHYGGEEEWEKYYRRPERNAPKTWCTKVSDLMRKHENVYADVSFTAAYRKFWPLLKVLLNSDGLEQKILFGSDFYMVSIKEAEKIFSIDLRAAVGEEEYRRMAEENPARFFEGREGT